MCRQIDVNRSKCCVAHVCSVSGTVLGRWLARFGGSHTGAGAAAPAHMMRAWARRGNAIRAFLLLLRKLAVRISSLAAQRPQLLSAHRCDDERKDDLERLLRRRVDSKLAAGVGADRRAEA